MRQHVKPEATEAAGKAFFEKLEYRLREKGMGTFGSRHEVLGVLTEEFKELTDVVQSNRPESFEDELIDIMVGAYWGLASSKNGTLD